MRHSLAGGITVAKAVSCSPGQFSVKGGAVTCPEADAPASEDERIYYEGRFCAECQSSPGRGRG